jgi:hypothetical protein
MKRVLTTIALSTLLVGCASDPYANRGSAPAPVGVQSGPVDLTKPEPDVPRPPGSLPTTHPSDPRGGIGGDVGVSRSEP